MVPPASRRVSRAPRYSGSRYVRIVVAPTGLSPSTARLSRRLGFLILPMSRPYNPARALTRAVWAGPLSLAATRGVACLFSPPAATKMFQFTAFASLPGSHLCGVSPFGHPRVAGCLRLAAEFRRLSRPSSPLGARASSVRPSSLLFLGGEAARAAAPRSLAQHVNVRPPPFGERWETTRVFQLPGPARLGPPERRCSSRTFRYGYLVTT